MAEITPWRACAGAALVSLLGALAIPAGAGAPTLAVIVHPSHTEPIDEPWLRLVYLKQRRYWDDGSPIVPVNRESGSHEREVFSTRVLRMTAARLAIYWNERYFEGTLPPITLSSNIAVKRYVAHERSAVGYVPPEEVDASVKVVLTIE